MEWATRKTIYSDSILGIFCYICLWVPKRPHHHRWGIPDSHSAPVPDHLVLGGLTASMFTILSLNLWGGAQSVHWCTPLKLCGEFGARDEFRTASTGELHPWTSMGEDPMARKKGKAREWGVSWNSHIWAASGWWKSGKGTLGRGQCLGQRNRVSGESDPVGSGGAKRPRLAFLSSALACYILPPFVNKRSLQNIHRNVHFMKQTMHGFHASFELK